MGSPGGAEGSPPDDAGTPVEPVDPDEGEMKSGLVPLEDAKAEAIL